MRIDGELIARVARLASLEVSGADAEVVAGQLGRIVEHFERLRNVPEEELGPLPPPEPGPVREDVPRPPGTPPFAMENAPESAHAHFVVPRVVTRG